MAHLGCVFTQHTLDELGNALRDHDSTTYLCAFESPSQLGVWLRREAIRRGMFCAREVVLLIDGASGLEKLGRDYFPDAVQIVDFFHAMEHLQILLEALLGEGDARALRRRRHRWKALLLADGVERIIAAARREALATGRLVEVERALGYFADNVERMRYGTFQSRGYFIGSGVIEAGCRAVIGQRCKQSGMFWSQRGAENVLALRCIHARRRTDAFWKELLNERAARNDQLSLAA